MKNIFIINGFPTSGKNEFTKFCKEILEEKYKEQGTVCTSIVDATKDMAYEMGLWDGGKTPSERKFLSGLKDLLDDYCDYSFDALQNYLKDDDIDFLFIDMREPFDIERACLEWKEYGKVLTVLVKRTGRDETLEYSNHADKEVMNYNYNCIIENNDDLAALKVTAETFLDMCLNETFAIS